MSNLDCSYCKYNFKFRFPYFSWKDVFKILNRKKFKTLTFLYGGKKWNIDSSCMMHRINSDLHIKLIKPLTQEQAIEENKKNSNYTLWDYHWPNIATIPPDWNVKYIKKIKKADWTAQVNIVVNHYPDEHKKDYCGIIKVKSGINAKIWLEKAWGHGK